MVADCEPPEIARVRVTQVRHRAVAAVLGAFVFAAVIVGGAALWPRPASEGPVTQSTPASTNPTSTTSAPQQDPTFTPSTSLAASGMTHGELTLLDGTQITLAYPPDLDLTSRAVQAEAAGGLDAIDRTVIARPGSAVDLVAQLERNFGPGELTDTYVGPEGNTVERWVFPDGAYIVFEFDSWAAYVWDATGDSREVAEGWSANLRGSVTPEGFLTLTADPPLTLVAAAEDPGPDGPDMTIEGTSGSLLVFLDDCDRMTRLDEEEYGREVFAFCDRPSNTLFFVAGSATVQQRVHEELAVVYLDSPRPVSPEPLFGEPVDVVLVFDDGIDGVLAVDPDLRIGSRRVIPGQRAGDQPYRLTRVHDSFVVGWSSVYAVDITTRESTLLDNATIYVPSVQPAQVWLVDYPSGRIQGTPMVWKSNLQGDPVSEPKLLDAVGFPAIGILGGLALETDDGVALWDAGSGSVIERLGSGPGQVKDSIGRLLAWCTGDCGELHITDLASGEDLTVAAPDDTVFSGRPFTGRAARFSPDGSRLAAIADDKIVMIYPATGEALVVGQLPTVEFGYFLGWSPDGSQLFASSFSYQQATTHLVRYHPATGTYESVELPFGGALSFVVLDRDEAAAYLRDQAQEPTDCPQVNSQPSGRSGVCGFRF